MPRRRSRRGRRRGGGIPIGTLYYEFEGIANFTPGAGNVSTINIKYNRLGITLDRPLRPVNATMSFVCTSGAAANINIQLVTPSDQTSGATSNVFPVGNTTKTISLRMPRSTDFVTPSSGDNLLRVNVYSNQPALGETTSTHVVWSGRVGIQHSLRGLPSNVKPVFDDESD